MKWLINRRILLPAILVAVALMLNNWLSGKREERSQQREAAAAHIADYFLRDFTATTMDLQGQPDHQLAGALMQHYADDGAMELTQPHLTLYANGRPSWRIDAAQGRLNAAGTELTLSGGVHIRSEDAASPMELNTDNMLIRPKERYAETDAALTLRHGQGEVQAVGLRAYMREERIQLLSQVRGRYVPAHP